MYTAALKANEIFHEMGITNYEVFVSAPLTSSLHAKRLSIDEARIANSDLVEIFLAEATRTGIINDGNVFFLPRNRHLIPNDYLERMNYTDWNLICMAQMAGLNPVQLEYIHARLEHKGLNNGPLNDRSKSWDERLAHLDQVIMAFLSEIQDLSENALYKNARPEKVIAFMHEHSIGCISEVRIAKALGIPVFSLVMNSAYQKPARLLEHMELLKSVGCNMPEEECPDIASFIVLKKLA